MEEARRTDEEVSQLPGLPQIKEDMLENILVAQRRFMDLIGVPALNLDGHGKEIEINDFVKMLTVFSQTCTTALNCETTELLDALPWKPWKKSYKRVDLNNVHLEIVDMMHFVLELALIWGLDAKSLHELYMKKMQENFDRQARGY